MPPPTLYPVKKLIAITAEMAEAISEYRHQQRISSENEAIRQLIETGLAAKPSGPAGGSTPGSARKPASTGTTATPRKPGRQASPAQSKEAQIRALREHGAP